MKVETRGGKECMEIGEFFHFWILNLYSQKNEGFKTKINIKHNAKMRNFN